MKLLVLSLFGVLASVLGQYEAPTSAQINDAKDALTTAFRSNAAFVPTTVRLGFHDCVGDKCDGCINLENSSNNGLADVIDFLEGIYVGNYDNIMSRADFWQLAAVTAAEFSANRSTRAGTAMPSTLMTVRWGRVDCSDSPSTSEVHTFPSPTMSHTEMMDYFSENYGFTKDEVVALMGAHTLGGANVENSGYGGTWISGEAGQFNHKYYQFLLGGDISYTNVARDRRDSDGDGDRKWQWNLQTDGTTVGFMLNTDMELVYDIPVDADDGTNTCSIVATDALPACDVATTMSTVETFANDATSFWNAYISVYDKLSMFGYDNLEVVNLS